MQLRPSARALVRLAVVLLVVGAIAGVWELLALQAPSSPVHFGELPGPVTQLRNTAVTLSLILFAVAWLMPWAAGDREPMLFVGAVHVGATVTLGAMIYGAARGLLGIQVIDPIPTATGLFVARIAGEAILFGCLIDFARRILMRPPPAPPEAP